MIAEKEITMVEEQVEPTFSLPIHKVYIASPYGRRQGASEEDCEVNVRIQIQAARLLIDWGYIPFIPNLYHYVHKGWASSPSEDIWTKIVSSWILDCDALLRLGGESIGADIEEQIARNLGLPIFYGIIGLKPSVQKEPSGL